MRIFCFYFAQLIADFSRSVRIRTSLLVVPGPRHPANSMTALFNALPLVRPLTSLAQLQPMVVVVVPPPFRYLKRHNGTPSSTFGGPANKALTLYFLVVRKQVRSFWQTPTGPNSRHFKARLYPHAIGRAATLA